MCILIYVFLSLLSSMCIYVNGCFNQLNNILFMNLRWCDVLLISQCYNPLNTVNLVTTFGAKKWTCTVEQVHNFTVAQWVNKSAIVGILLEDEIRNEDNAQRIKLSVKFISNLNSAMEMVNELSMKPPRLSSGDRFRAKLVWRLLHHNLKIVAGNK